MAEVKVKYCCGCGYTATNLVDAVLHSDQTGHSLDATGQVKADKKEVKKEG